MGRWIFVTIAVAALFSATKAQAARLFFSETAPDFNNDVNLGITSADDSIPVVPTIDLNVGEQKTLWIWFKPLLRTGTANDEKYPGYSYNIEASGTGVSAVSHSTLNPMSFSVDDGAFVGPRRWTSAVNGAVAPTTSMVTNALALTASGANLGVGNSNSTFTNDGARDGTAAADPNASRAFAFGQIVVRGETAGTTTGLYLRIGTGGFLVRTGGATTSAAASVQFGDSAQTWMGDQFGQGDPISADLALADAVIRVGGQPVRTELIQFTADPNNTGQICTFGPPSNVMPLNCVVSPAANKMRVDARGVQHDFFDVFFDFNQDDPVALQTLVTTLTAQESDEGLEIARVIPNGENALGLGIDYDIHLRYTNIPNADRLLDVDVSSIQGLQINNVAIPEPSTWALVACGLLGLAMARRRRR